MFLKTVLLLILSFNLYSYELQRNYYVHSSTITISDIIPKSQSKKIILQIQQARHSKRIKAKELIALLKKYGYNNITSKYPYIQFNLKSPIDTKELKKHVRNYYEKNYPDIKIKSISVEPNSYLEKLPEQYSVEFKRDAYLRRTSIFNIKTYEKKKIFFNYSVDATIRPLFARAEIKKSEEISKINSKKKSIILENFRAKPLFKVEKGLYEAKHKIKESSLITIRDVVPLVVVKRGSDITVTLHEPNITITFRAKALKSAHLGESIYVTNDNGKKIEVVVTGKNQAEVK